jgi:hypothetical protein
MRRALLAIREHVGKVDYGAPETAFYRLGAIDSEAMLGLGDPLALMPLGEVNHGGERPEAGYEKHAHLCPVCCETKPCFFVCTIATMLGKSATGLPLSSPAKCDECEEADHG